jgi:hypothetical protein
MNPSQWPAEDSPFPEPDEPDDGDDFESDDESEPEEFPGAD